MKINIQLVFIIVLLFVFQNANAQWVFDTPTAAEAAARDKPYAILQNEIERKLCDKEWSIDQNPFLYFKDHPEATEITRGKNAHYFIVGSWGAKCKIELNKTSPLYKEIMDSSKNVSTRLGESYKYGPDLQKDIANAMKTGGHISPKGQAMLDKKHVITKQCLDDLARLQNAQQYANIALFINRDGEGHKQAPAGGYPKGALKSLTVAGVQQAVLFITNPYEDDPDTTYFANLYIGNWPKPHPGDQVLFPYKYNTKYSWTDKVHSGKPIIENFCVEIYTSHYSDMMKVIHSIDWTKLEALVKK